MRFVTAALLLYPTYVFILGIVASVYRGSLIYYFRIDDLYLNYAFFAALGLSLFAGWYATIRGFDVKKDGLLNAKGMGVLIGVFVWPPMIINLFLEGMITFPLLFVAGWLGLLAVFVPPFSRRRNVQVLASFATAVLIGWAGINVPHWWQEYTAPRLAQAHWGIYHPDYSREPDTDFVEKYRDYSERNQISPKITLYDRYFFVSNTLGVRTLNTFGYCGVENRHSIFYEGGGFLSDETCDQLAETARTWSLTFEEDGAMRCAECKSYGKPEFWQRVAELPDYFFES